MLAMLLNLFLTLAASFTFAELFGHFIHRLLHSDSIHFLSESHMIHHLRIYGPKKSLRPEKYYLSAVEGRAAIGNTGLEWIIPVGTTSLLVSAVFWMLQLPLFNLIVFLLGNYFWGWFMFGYMHDRMHIQGVWLEKNRFLRGWFLEARKRHDIHHQTLSDEGKMPNNFGICFFGFDRIFGTYRDTRRAFNEAGYQAALERYSFIFRDGAKA